MRASLRAGGCCCVGEVSRSMSRASCEKDPLEVSGAGLSCGPANADSP
jgi:hypothetical protein